MCDQFFMAHPVIDKNPAANNGWTPLHSAAKNGHYDIYKLIMDKVENKNIFYKQTFQKTLTT